MRQFFVAIAGVALALAATAQPAAANIDEKVVPKPAPTGLPIQSANAQFSLADDCTTVRAQLPTFAKSAAKSKKKAVACDEPTSPEKRKERAQEKKEPTGEPSIMLEPFPLWCTDVPGQWTYSPEVGRENACLVQDRTLSVINVNTGAVIGQIYYDLFAFEYTSSTITTFAYQIMLDQYGGWGQISGTFVQGSATCTGACTVSSSDFEPQAVTTSSSPDGEAFFQSTATTRGSVGNATATWSYFFVNPSWVAPSDTVSIPTLVTRCDHNLPGNNTVAGCVIRDLYPFMFYSYSGPYQELAWHILAAQDSGLAGSHPAYGLPYPAPLHRLINATQQTANYSKSCPSSYPRPSGLSCDEYPFQSSYEGAYTGGGSGRTFPGCQVPLPSGSGPNGYSACMIDNTENSEGGSALGSFYVDQRILDNDAFYVWITP